MKCVLLILFIVFNSYVAHAKWVQGYYISNNDDTVFTSFDIQFSTAETLYEPIKSMDLISNMIPVFSKMEFGLYSRDSLSKKTFLTPSDAKSLYFSYNGNEYKFTSINLGLLYLDKLNHNEMVYLTRKGFYLNLIEGEVNLYLEELSSSGHSEFIIQKGNDPYFVCNKYSSKFQEYFSDCPDVLEILKQRTKQSNPITVVSLVNTYNFYCYYNTTNSKNFSLPDFYQSKTQFKESYKNYQYNFVVQQPIDNREKYYGTRFKYKKRLKIQPNYYRWSRTPGEIVTSRIISDLKSFDAIDTSLPTLTIIPTIQIFFVRNTGFMFNKTHSKIRISFSVVDNDNNEVLNQTYETIYSSSGHDADYEGHFIAWEWIPPNIVTGMCLRKTLDKFYEGLLRTLKRNNNDYEND